MSTAWSSSTGNRREPRRLYCTRDAQHCYQSPARYQGLLDSRPQAFFDHSSDISVDVFTVFSQLSVLIWWHATCSIPSHAATGFYSHTMGLIGDKAKRLCTTLCTNWPGWLPLVIATRNWILLRPIDCKAACPASSRHQRHHRLVLPRGRFLGVICV